MSTNEPDYVPPPNPYTEQEIKAALKLFHYLPPTLPIIIDISTVLPWVSKELRDVFELYTHGMRLIQISQYWTGIHPSVAVVESNGWAAVNRLAKQLHYYLGLREERVPFGNDKA